MYMRHLGIEAKQRRARCTGQGACKFLASRLRLMASVVGHGSLTPIGGLRAEGKGAGTMILFKPRLCLLRLESDMGPQTFVGHDLSSGVAAEPQDMSGTACTISCGIGREVLPRVSDGRPRGEQGSTRSPVEERFPRMTLTLSRSAASQLQIVLSQTRTGVKRTHWLSPC